jgi:hypothetical protein
MRVNDEECNLVRRQRLGTIPAPTVFLESGSDYFPARHLVLPFFWFLKAKQQRYAGENPRPDVVHSYLAASESSMSLGGANRDESKGRPMS